MGTTATDQLLIVGTTPDDDAYAEDVGEDVSENVKEDDSEAAWQLDEHPEDDFEEDDLAEGHWGENKRHFSEECTVAEMMAIDPEVPCDPPQELELLLRRDRRRYKGRRRP